jgi:hypothetical protein
VTVTLTMSESDLRTAVEGYARQLGYVVDGTVRFEVTKGDRPGESDSVRAIATVKPVERDR